MAIKVKGCTVIDDSRNVNAGVSTATTGCVTGTLTAGTVNGGVVCATSCFSGSGSGLSNIPSAAITGLSGGGGFCVFTGPGTFSVPPGTTSLKITATGGGGNGGLTPTGRGTGGSAGAAAVKLLSVPPACSSYPVTIGGATGNTIFGGPTVFVANGGNSSPGGFTYVAGIKSAPPTATYGLFQRNSGLIGTWQPTNADLVCVSNPAGWGCRVITSGGADLSNDAGQGGSGGSNLFGMGGDGNGCPGCGYGGGGGGGNPGTGAGTGAPGFVIVEW